MREIDERDCVDGHADSQQAEIDRLQAENVQLRELMNVYNLGGWTESLALIKERDQLKSWIENAARLTALMAADAALWADAKHIETAYVQQALRYLTLYIEGQWGFYRTYDALEEMQP